VTSASLRGKRSVIVFFNTGCPDCQEELPVVQELYDAVKGDANIELVCISREEGEESIRAYWQANGLTLPYSPQEDAAVFRLFASHTIPRIYIANATATITATFADNPKATLGQLKAALGI
jgi:thiol-disulfide isomerase/thioredoxin